MDQVKYCFLWPFWLQNETLLICIQRTIFMIKYSLEIRVGKVCDPVSCLIQLRTWWFHCFNRLQQLLSISAEEKNATGCSPDPAFPRNQLQCCLGRTPWWLWCQALPIGYPGSGSVPLPESGLSFLERVSCTGGGGGRRRREREKLFPNEHSDPVTHKLSYIMRANCTLTKHQCPPPLLSPHLQGGVIMSQVLQLYNCSLWVH